MKQIKVRKIYGATFKEGDTTTLYETLEELKTAHPEDVLERTAENYWDPRCENFGVVVDNDGWYVYVSDGDEYKVVKDEPKKDVNRIEIYTKNGGEYLVEDYDTSRIENDYLCVIKGAEKHNFLISEIEYQMIYDI